MNRLEIKRNVPLSSYTTFRVGGNADYLIEINDTKDIPEAISFIQEKELPFFVLGGGSNILVSDAPFAGVILTLNTKGISFEPHGSLVRMSIEAGENWDDVVARATDESISGLESLSWIPGKAGAAPIQNIGAYGKELMDVCESVHAVNVRTGKERIFSKEECGFSYRNSFFKTKEGKEFLITKFHVLLNPKETPSIVYKDLKEYFETSKMPVNSKNVRDAVIAIRKRKLPDISEYGTAGSFFKNPILSKDEFEQLQKKYPDVLSFPAQNDRIKVSAAWILDHACHLKGFREGNVGLFERQPLAIVNFGGATAKEIFSFAEFVAGKVFDATGISLEWEVERVGFTQ